MSSVQGIIDRQVPEAAGLYTASKWLKEIALQLAIMNEKNSLSNDLGSIEDRLSEIQGCIARHA